MSFWLLYAIAVLDDVGQLAGFLGLLTFVVGFIGIGICRICIATESENSSEYKAAGKFLPVANKALILGIIAMFISCAIPNKDEWKLIIGGYFVTNIEGIDKFPPEIVGAAHNFLEKYGTDDKNSNAEKK